MFRVQDLRLFGVQSLGFGVTGCLVFGVQSLRLLSVKDLWFLRGV